MGKLVYVPESMKKDELNELLECVRGVAAKVDHYIARSRLNEVYSELFNEVDNVEKGYRVSE